MGGKWETIVVAYITILKLGDSSGLDGLGILTAGEE